MKKILSLLLLVIVASACSDNKGSSSEKKELILKTSPTANADSLYAFVEKQVAFGPRVPNTQAHKEAADWFVQKFKSYGATVGIQAFESQVYDGTKVSLKNIIASFNPDAKKRILLAAHWDTRPFSDRDEENTKGTLDGANDGGSGVAVLLEIARIISEQAPPTVGIDMILFDGEDWGEHAEETGENPQNYGLESWWCLGSQHWAKNKGNYRAYYGILLDMVGGPNAKFHYDNASRTNAGLILEKVWDVAHAKGYQNYFKKQQGFAGIEDDHIYVNKAGIPMIDIIDFQNGNFTAAWHTQNDNLENISKESMQVVANVVLAVLYNE